MDIRREKHIYGVEDVKQKNIVYKATCKQCRKFYIGNTQNKAKLRFTQHYASVGKKLKKGISDSRYAKHWQVVM